MPKQHSIRQYLRQIGRKRLVVLISMSALLLAVILDTLIASLLGHEFKFGEDGVRAFILPLIIAPVISWYLVGLLLRLESLEMEMSKIAAFDHLTGLLNRRAFMHSGEALHRLSQRNGKHYCMLAVDLDHFKQINDQYGHAGGDEALRCFGQIARDLSRSSDLIGRLGGEEFAFLLPGTELSQAMDFAERLREEIREGAIQYQGRAITYTLSIGIASPVQKPGATLEDVLLSADHALYAAKRAGRNRVLIFKPEMV